MKIIMLRHGKVDYPPVAIMSAAAFADWVDSYNNNRLDPLSVPDNGVVELAQQANAVVCSSLPRSISSARCPGCSETTIIDPLFDEAGLPVPRWSFPFQSVRIWVILFRLSWFLGYSANSETFRQAKLRAAQAASRLEELAGDHGSVLFVGHGVINRMIARQLLSRNWSTCKKPASGYWQYGLYEKKDYD